MLIPPLAAPDFDSLTLRTRSVDSTKLFRISRHAAGEPFFGKFGTNRFDDPLQRFGTCYLGFDIATAVAETVLHNAMPVNGRFAVSQGDFESRQVVRLQGGGRLVLANLTGTALKTLVGDSSISTIIPYDLPQQWSAAIHGHRANVDGIFYVSRQLNDRKAVVLFERAKSKMGSATCQVLGASPSVLRGLRRSLNIDYAMP